MCRRLFTMLFIFLLASCSKQVRLTDPVFQPQITNQTDSFALQVTNLTGVTQTLSYSWQNTGTRADINQASQITSGSATLTILDAAGQQVYTSSLGSNGTFTTATGTSGNWTIRITTNDVRGSLNFRVQRP
jgi:hypothetical protein